MPRFEAISEKKLAQLNEGYLADNEARIVRNALTENDIAKKSKRSEGTGRSGPLGSVCFLSRSMIKASPGAFFKLYC